MSSTRLRLAAWIAAGLVAAGCLTLAVVNLAAARALQGTPVTSGVVGEIEADLGEQAVLPFQTVTQVLAALERRANERALARVRSSSWWALAALLPASAATGWLLAGWWERRRDAALPALPVDPDATARAAFRALVEEASHELRNPLAVVTTNLDLVASSGPSDDPAATRQAAQAAQRAARRMAATLDGLAAGTLDPASPGTRPAVAIDAVTAGVVEEFGPLAGARGVSVEQVQGGPGATVRGDRLALRRALANLVANAVRLAPSGSTVRCASGVRGAWVWTGVADEGPGIPAEAQPHVFERGWQGTTRPHDGRPGGLGLAIVRQVAEGHGGLVRLHSREGVGTHVVLWLPAAGERMPMGPASGADPPHSDPLGDLGTDPKPAPPPAL
ncbi:MAG: HAMP domain-containing histidine kinase [Acidimicrobiales bacterium]|nr:HAMP domain-containing histidine kinase [Acidimicrobiales bacterium]